jgi:colanic acid biosynthesis protein WcaH
MANKEPTQLSPEKLVEVIKNAPLVSIDLVVRNNRDEILVGMRKNEPAKGSWFVPGGRILKDERIAEAFERIGHHELGIRLSFKEAHLLGVFEHLYATNFTEKEEFGTHYVVLAYQVKIDESALGLDLPKDQHSEYKWLSKESLGKEQNIHPYTRVYFDCHR